MRRTVRNGAVVFACIHLALSALIILGTYQDPMCALCFSVMDFPLVVGLEQSTWIDALFDAMSPSGTLGIPPFVLFGTAMYALFGAFVGWCVAGIRARLRQQKGLCLKCGYDLTGNVSGVCSECGEVIQEDCANTGQP